MKYSEITFRTLAHIEELYRILENASKVYTFLLFSTLCHSNLGFFKKSSQKYVISSVLVILLNW